MKKSFQLPVFSPEKTIFLLLSFEGPDVYSQAGGLGVRMSELSRALALEGHETHLFFVGDPALPGEEKFHENHLIYHRWGQWISHYHPHGVYDGEEGKILDYQRSLPLWIFENIFSAPSNQNKQIVVLSEEWHTAETVTILSHLAQTLNQNKILFLWNANNTFGFHRLNWPSLKQAAVITTVSKYMKHLMWKYQVNPFVIPNGIPKRWFNPLDESLVKALKKSVDAEIFLAKVGRFDPDKRWIMAVQSMALLAHLGFRVKLLMRGGMEPHGEEVRRVAQNLGLKIKTIKLPKEASLELFFKAIREAPEAHILDLQFFVPEEMLRLIYRSADAVLANSSHEPFGLVGLEVMACRGIAITGNTGEDYAQNFYNAIVVESDDPLELAASLATLASSASPGEKLRERGVECAKAFLWEHVILELKRKLAYISLRGRKD